MKCCMHTPDLLIRCLVNVAELDVFTGVIELVKYILRNSKIDTCSEIEFNCGNGQCVPGLSICDMKYDCLTGADELLW